MRSAPSPPALLRAFDRAVEALRGAERRPMFGYPAMFVNGNMFAGLVRDMMILRLTAKDRDRLLAIPGAKPFIAMKGRVMKQRAVVPPAMLKSPQPLRRWLGKALAYGRSLPPKATRARASARRPRR